MDDLTKKILQTVNSANEPFLETTDVAKKVGQPTYLVLLRLRKLAVDGKIKGHQVRGARGAWIWWPTKRSRR